MVSGTLLVALLSSGFPSLRVAVLVDDPAPGEPARAALERTLQERGYEVVSADVVERMRAVVAPKALLGERLPEGLSVLEADAILAGAAAYGEATSFEGVSSVPATLTARLIDLGSGRTHQTKRTEGVGLGVSGPSQSARGAEQAVDRLFADKQFAAALGELGQSAGLLTLIVQGVPDREALLEIRRGLERAMAGAPVKELYFAKGLAKLLVGGSEARSLVGPDVADIIGETKALALIVEEVANTRIVARYSRARAVNVVALVLRPKVPARMSGSADELGRYVATHIATFEFAKASYQPGRLSRAEAKAQAAKVGATVLVESEVLGGGPSAALTIRVVDAKTGAPIFREQRLIEQNDSLKTAEAMLAVMRSDLPQRLIPELPQGSAVVTNPTARGL